VLHPVAHPLLMMIMENRIQSWQFTRLGHALHHRRFRCGNK
jgi:hypothetical protein